QHRLGTSLVALCFRVLPNIRGDCHSIGHDHAFQPLRATLARVERSTAASAGNPLLHGLARGISLSWLAAKYPGPVNQERGGRMVDGVGAVRLLAYHQP